MTEYINQKKSLSKIKMLSMNLTCMCTPFTANLIGIIAVIEMFENYEFNTFMLNVG
jgi:hypothetical protein